MDDNAQERTPEQERIQVERDGRVIASAVVRSTPEPSGVAEVALQRQEHDVPPAVRQELVDQVLDVPGVSNSDSVHVVLPVGDDASIRRIQERTTSFDAHRAGYSAVVDASLPEDGEPSRASE